MTTEFTWYYVSDELFNLLWMNGFNLSALIVKCKEI